MAPTDAEARLAKRRNPSLRRVEVPVAAWLKVGGRWSARRLAVLVLVLVFAFPFLVMLSSAFKNAADIFHAPPQLLPRDWTLDNFREAFRQIPIWRYLGNTLLICGLNVLGTIVSCPLVAYALSKIHWRGRMPMLMIVLGTMMIPPQVTLIPIYLMWNHIGTTDSYIPLVVPAFLGTPFLIFMLRQFLISVPDELIEASRIDGASELRTYWSIVLPLARPALATAAVFQFVWTWTDFLNPLLYLNDTSKYTLSIGLYNFFSENGVEWGPLMAACVMFTLPAFIVFLLGQRYFVEGISTSGLK